MKLYKLCENVYYSDFEQLRDRPRLGYIKGEKFSVAIDAGHSDEHVQEFYQVLKENNLPLPQLTILTHWHWDHTFALHAINGISLANKKTNAYLRDFIRNQNPQSEQEFLNFDPSIRNEYHDGKAIIVKSADIEFENRVIIDLGNIQLEVMQAPSPHSDDATIIYLPQQKVIFIGDGTSGTPPNWQIDHAKGQAMIDFLSKIDFTLSVGGHWQIETKEEVLKTLTQDVH